MLRVRSLVARAISFLGFYYLGQSLLSRYRGGFILAYHDLPPGRFATQIEALKPNEPVSLSELVGRAKQGRSTRGIFSISVDDGVGDTVRSITDISIDRGWPVTFFLPTHYLDNPTKGMVFQWVSLIENILPHAGFTVPGIGDIDLSTEAKRIRFKKRMEAMLRLKSDSESARYVSRLKEYLERNGQMPKEYFLPEPITWEEVARLSRYSEIDFGSHGVHHGPVSSLSEQELLSELIESKTRILQFTEGACEHFCYPYGDPVSIGERAPAFVEKYYESGVTISRGRVGSRSCFGLLPRIPIYEQDSPYVARLKILTL